MKKIVFLLIFSIAFVPYSPQIVSAQAEETGSVEVEQTISENVSTTAETPTSSPKVITTNNPSGNWIFGKPAKTITVKDENNVAIDNYTKPTPDVKISSGLLTVEYELPDTSKQLVYEQEIPADDLTGALIRAFTDPRVFVVEENGSINLIENQEIAARLFGQEWEQQVVWVDDAIRNGYPYGYRISLK